MKSSVKFQRSRLLLAFAIAVVVALGLGSRQFPALVPAVLGSYPGDSAWALMVFLAWCFCRPRTTTVRLAALAFSTACLVEFSQLYQAPWLNAIRGTMLGHLVLGSTFTWGDIAAYANGVLIGASIDASLSARSPAQES